MENTGYQEIFLTYQQLKNNLEDKKRSIIKKDTQTLAQLDEESIALCEKIEKFDIVNISKTFSEKEKESLKEIAKQIKEIQTNNEILIKHRLDVINSTLSGILNIIQEKSNSYNSKGESYNNERCLDISSITEEA